MEILLSLLSKSDGSIREATRTVGDGLAVGRGAEDGILLDGGDLSREHFVLTHDGAALYIADLSANGTWLNGRQLKKSIKTHARPADSIEVPGYALTFRIVEQQTENVPEVEHPMPLSSVYALAGDDAIVASKHGPLAALDPAFKFLASFTMLEKITFLVAAGGLLLLYTYAAS